jgi:hypothetical protein
MPSRALEALYEGLDEISALQRANPSPRQGGGLTRPDVTRAMGRAEVVLLCSHLERFVYALWEQSVETLHVEKVSAGDLPERLRLLHAHRWIDEAARTSWENRANQLTQLATNVSPHWVNAPESPRLDHEIILRSMKTPSPKALIRAFRDWDIPDVFSSITNTPHHNKRLRLKLLELAEKRNNIAHGDFTEEATYLDVQTYRRAVKDFAERTDRLMARRVQAIAVIDRPW